MTTTAAFGWGSSHLNTTPAGEVDLDPAEQLAVQQTLARYAFALDHGDLVALENVLTEDAIWTVRIAGEAEQGPFVGRAAILDLVRDATEAQTEQRRHHLINVVFHRADADTAVVWAYLMLTSNAGGTSNVITTGFYTITLRKADSKWRIANLFVGMDNNAM
ncbi:ketosteroid isomerase-like protein [Streptomyces sp. LBL]|uniref:nuclear transport factor 2 family protein n=1 Tax=Streptomyces sp. LBL TaxID=2940562 RepID=UPI002476D944|nr:nuclear transport factor 2 family protein [Streptomyces sp. LBL]MDH6624245.1 ketosteroid isomerase-like protein [Streptomyces sp. LBL]